MIELFRTPSSNRWQVSQKLVPPVVYLDTWAICEFSENDALGDRFRAALLRSCGTLALSDINLTEFTTFEDRRNAEAAGQFIDTLFPQLFLLTSDPTKVIAREEEFLAGALAQSPAGFEEALIQFAEAAARRGGRFSPYGRPATQQLVRAIVDDLQRDRRVTESTNNAVDLLHAVVPAAYCHFVLLDGQWVDRLQRAVSRLSAAAIPVQLRAAYSKRQNGIGKFLEALESWPTPTA